MNEHEKEIERFLNFLREKIDKAPTEAQRSTARRTHAAIKWLRDEYRETSEALKLMTNRT